MGVGDMKPVERLAYWVRERDSVRVKRKAGGGKPWTDDPILRAYRFCNVRRMDDKVSQWLLHTWYAPHRGHPNMMYAVALARFFNKPETLLPLTNLVFAPKWQPTLIKRALRSLPPPVFNAAYMVRGGLPGGAEDKIGAVVDVYVESLRREIPGPYRTDSMEKLHADVCRPYGFSSFMAGQVVADLRWAVEGKWEDRLTWAPPGPGSRRGLARLWGDEYELGYKEFGNAENWQTAFREEVLEVLPKMLPYETACRLEAMDYQNCLCEFDKYERVRLGQGRPKQRYDGG